MRVVHNRSIPNVDDERLLDSLAQLHIMLHTVEGLHELELGHGKVHVQMGMKCLMVRDELKRRGVPITVDCTRWCSA